MKDIFFKPSRFMNLSRKDMVESWKYNLLQIAMLYGIMVVLFVVSGFFSYNSYTIKNVDGVVKFSLDVYSFLLVLLGSIFASMNMSKLRTKTSKISLFMTPGTPFEKFFSRWVISTIIFLIVFTIVYLLADYTRVLIYTLAYPKANVEPASLKYFFTAGHDTYYYHGTQSEINMKFIIYLVYQSFFILGSSIWPKNSFIKTLTAGIFIVISYSILTLVYTYLVWKRTSIAINNSGISFDFIEKIPMYIMVLGLFILFLNWIVAYFRYKESDIIE